jgi:hypothetical protein
MGGTKIRSMARTVLRVGAFGKQESLRPSARVNTNARSGELLKIRCWTRYAFATHLLEAGVNLRTWSVDAAYICGSLDIIRD